jgi:ABC-type sugar transport system ATPase subunit
MPPDRITSDTDPRPRPDETALIMATRLEMRSISKEFPGVRALTDVSLEADSGQILALVGENGAGKSTLIKILSGAVRPDAGEILIDGAVTDITTPRDAERHGVSTVYQELNLFPRMSVAENLLFRRYPKRRRAITWRGVRLEAAGFLRSIGIDLPVDRPAGDLSIAQRQILEIAKALYREVRILILDEPTAVLGGADVDRLVDTVRSLRTHGVATIFISHRLDEIFGLADSYVVLKDGHRVGAGGVRDTNHEALVSMMVGRDLAALPPATPTARSDEALRVEHLSRAGVLHDISFSLRKGEVLGVAGLRGAGRTELARAIFGADPYDSGEIYVDGQRVGIGSTAEGIAHGIGLVPEDRGTQGLFKGLSTVQNIAMVLLAARRDVRVRPREERRLAEEYVRSLGIRLSSLAAPVGMLSGGNQQKVVLAKWLAADVSVLILDEPTRGVDVGGRADIYEIIRHNLAGKGVGVLLISSELPEILEMSDRVLVMRQGRIVGEVGRGDATEELIMSYAVTDREVTHA